MANEIWRAAAKMCLRTFSGFSPCIIDRMRSIWHIIVREARGLT